MFESHFGLRENPFASGHQPRFVYPSREHQEALAHLRYGIENLEPFVLITGEVGTGKTTALFEALGELQARVSVALITNSALTRGELIEEICLRFGVGLAQPITKPQAMAQFERHLLALRGRGERAILLIDEAQNFDRELLEEVRLLSNLEASGEKLLQIFLIGQPELEGRLTAPELRQLRQRIAVHYRLRPLDREETAHYIRHRVAAAGGDAERLFPAETCHEAHAVTNGIPREVNQICAQAMIDAFVDGAPSVSPAHIRAAAAETSFQSVLPAAETDPRLPPPLPAWPAAVAPRMPAAPVAQTAPAATPVAAPEPVAAPAPPPEPLAKVTPEVVAPQEPPAPVAPPEPVAPPQPETIIPPAEHVSDSPAPDPQATRWEAWVASLVKQSEAEVEAAQVREATLAKTPAAAAPAEPAPPPAVPETPTPIRTRYAAETAIGPPPAETPKPTADWRPPRWSYPGTDATHLEEPKGKKGGNLILKLLAGLAVLAVLAIATILLFRLGPWQPKEVEAPMPITLAEERTTSPSADSSFAAGSSGSPAESTAAAAPTTPSPAATQPQATTQPPATAPAPAGATQQAAVGAPPATSVAPATRQEFGVSVGTYLDRARAQAEVSRLNAAGISPVRISVVRSEGVTMHAVIIGAYAGRATAEREANAMIGRGLVDEARIISRTVAARP